MEEKTRKSYIFFNFLVSFCFVYNIPTSHASEIFRFGYTTRYTQPALIWAPIIRNNRHCNYIFFNFQYLLSSGKDSLIKLWELSTSRCLIAYTGAGTTGNYLLGWIPMKYIHLFNHHFELKPDLIFLRKLQKHDIFLTKFYVSQF